MDLKLQTAYELANKLRVDPNVTVATSLFHYIRYQVMCSARLSSKGVLEGVDPLESKVEKHMLTALIGWETCFPSSRLTLLI